MSLSKITNFIGINREFIKTFTSQVSIGIIYTAPITISIFAYMKYIGVNPKTPIIVKKTNVSNLNNHVISLENTIKRHIRFCFMELGLVTIPFIGLYYNQKISFDGFKYAMFSSIGMELMHLSFAFTNIIGHNIYSQILNDSQTHMDNSMMKISGENNIITQHINKEMCSWVLYEYTNLDGKITYVVQNTYDPNAIFVFKVKRLAQKFYEEIKLINVENTEILINYPSKAKEMQRQFFINYYSSNLSNSELPLQPELSVDNETF